MPTIKLIEVHTTSGLGLAIESLAWLIVTYVAICIVILLKRIYGACRARYKVVRLNIRLGNIGEIELQPTLEDIQIAHKIWVELITRKAAMPIDIENEAVSLGAIVHERGDRTIFSGVPRDPTIREHIVTVSQKKATRRTTPRQKTKTFRLSPVL